METNDNFRRDRDDPFQNLAAELTVAAHRVAVQHALEGVWLDLQISMWIALVKKVNQFRMLAPSPRLWLLSPFQRELMLAEFTDAAYQTMLEYRPSGSFVDIELGLYEAFRLTLQSIPPTLGQACCLAR